MQTSCKRWLAATVVGCTMAVAGSAQAQGLNVVGSWSSLELYKKFEQPFWSEVLPKADTDFNVQVTSFDQMGIKGGDVFRYLGDGMFNVGMTVADYTVQDAPELEALDFPLIAPDVETAHKVADAYRPLAEKAMQKRFNSHVLAIVPYPAQVVFCNKPITNLADLKGKKVRASGRTTSEFIEGLGGQSVSLAFNEVPAGLQRGVIDCAITGSLSGYSAHWYEMADHLLPVPVGGWDYVMTAINDDTWNDLTADQQKTLQQLVDTKFTAKVWANAEVDTQQGIACLTGDESCTKGKPANMTLVEATDEDFELTRKILREQVIPSWSKRVNQQAVDDWNKQVGSLIGITVTK